MKPSIQIKLVQWAMVFLVVFQAQIIMAQSHNSGSKKITLQFTDLQISGKSVAPNQPESPLTKTMNETTELILSPHQTDFTIAFGVKEPEYQDSVQYSIKMEGLDSEWISVGKQNKGMYAHIPPGIYIFKVKAAFVGQADSPENEITLHIKINPSFWQTWWFRLLSLAVIGVVVYTLVRKLRAKNKK